MHGGVVDMACGDCSLQTQLSLQYRAEQIAVAVVHLAMKMLRSEAPLWDGRHWWQHCNVSAAELEGALHGPFAGSAFPRILSGCMHRIFPFPSCSSHNGASLLANSGCAGADMVFQILRVLDKSSRPVDYSNFGPNLPGLPSGDAGHMQQYQSPEDAAPGSSTHLMLTDGTPALETGLTDGQPAHGSDEWGSLAQQPGFERNSQ